LKGYLTSKKYPNPDPYEFYIRYMEIYINSVSKVDKFTRKITDQNFYVTDGNIMYLTDASRFLICVIQHYAPVVGWGGGGGTDA
jgi:hypothetical protein